MRAVLRSRPSRGNANLGHRAFARARSMRASAAVGTNGYKYLSQAEIPPHIPREDFMRQMVRWAVVEFTSEDARRTYGCPFEVEPLSDDGVPVGFEIKVLKYAVDGTTEVVEELLCSMDDQFSEGFDLIARNADGFPEARTMDGEPKLVQGKNFVVQRKERPVTPESKAVLKEVLTSIALSTNKYYAFGSNFTEEF